MIICCLPFKKWIYFTPHSYSFSLNLYDKSELTDEFKCIYFRSNVLKTNENTDIY